MHTGYPIYLPYVYGTISGYRTYYLWMDYHNELIAILGGSCNSSRNNSCHQMVFVQLYICLGMYVGMNVIKHIVMLLSHLEICISSHGRGNEFLFRVMKVLHAFC